MVTYIFLHNFIVQFIPFKLGRLKKIFDQKKTKTKSVHKAWYLRVQITTLKGMAWETSWADMSF